MQLEFNFSLVLNNSTFTDFTGISPNLHPSKLYHLHSLPPSRSRVTTGLGLLKSLQRLHFLGQSWLHTWENGCLPKAQAVIHMIHMYHGPRAELLSQKGGEERTHLSLKLAIWSSLSVDRWSIILYKQCYKTKEKCMWGRPVSETISVYRLLLLLLASELGFILQRCHLNKSEDCFKM